MSNIQVQIAMTTCDDLNGFGGTANLLTEIGTIVGLQDIRQTRRSW
jgi:hypothetical protein